MGQNGSHWVKIRYLGLLKGTESLPSVGISFRSDNNVSDGWVIFANEGEFVRDFCFFPVFLYVLDSQVVFHGVCRGTENNPFHKGFWDLINQ